MGEGKRSTNFSNSGGDSLSYSLLESGNCGRCGCGCGCKCIRVRWFVVMILGGARLEF